LIYEGVIEQVRQFELSQVLQSVPQGIQFYPEGLKVLELQLEQPDDEHAVQLAKQAIHPLPLIYDGLIEQVKQPPLLQVAQLVPQARQV